MIFLDTVHHTTILLAMTFTYIIFNQYTILIYLYGLLKIACIIMFETGRSNESRRSNQKVQTPMGSSTRHHIIEKKHQVIKIFLYFCQSQKLHDLLSSYCNAIHLVSGLFWIVLHIFVIIYSPWNISQNQSIKLVRQSCVWFPWNLWEFQFFAQCNNLK